MQCFEVSPNHNGKTQSIIFLTLLSALVFLEQFVKSFDLTIKFEFCTEKFKMHCYELVFLRETFLSFNSMN